MNWICSQLGAREHYAVPRALHGMEKLSVLYTDFWAGRWSKLFGLTHMPGIVRPLAGRFHKDLTGAKIVAWNACSVSEECKFRYRSRKGARSQFLSFCEIGKRFSERVRDVLQSTHKEGDAKILFTYDTGGLEAMRWCRSHGIKSVLGQMDPGRIEYVLVKEEESRWPHWGLGTLQIPEAYFERREEEWALADKVVVNSEYCRQALLQQGVPEEKLAVIPLSFEETLLLKASLTAVASKRSGGEPLRVLWLGQVILRKGIQYLMTAARAMLRENVRFDVVGPVGISKAALASAPANMTFHGRVARHQAADWYRCADVFVLPTLSDGFAITQLEAMAHGLPVIATHCCGSVVTHGVDGFIVPPRNSAQLTEAIQRYVDEPELLQKHRADALTKSRQFTLNHLAGHLRNLEIELSRSPSDLPSEIMTAPVNLNGTVI